MWRRVDVEWRSSSFFNFINIHLWRVDFLLVFGTVVALVVFLSLQLLGNCRAAEIYISCAPMLTQSSLGAFICTLLPTLQPTSSNIFQSIFQTRTPVRVSPGISKPSVSFNFFLFRTNNGAKEYQALSHSELCTLYHSGG